MCQASEALCLERYGTRAASGRATAHFDHSVIDAWGKETTFDDGAPALGIPILEVDTSHGYRPPLPDLLAPCYALFGHP